MIATYTVLNGTDLKQKILNFLKSQNWSHNTSKDIIHKDDVYVSFNIREDGMTNWNPSATTVKYMLATLYSNEDDSIPQTAFVEQVAGCGPIYDYEMNGKHYTKEEPLRYDEGVGLIVFNQATAYFNYTEEPQITFTVSLKEEIDNQIMWQHMTFGMLEKDVDYDGGTFISSTRSKYALIPYAETVSCIDITSAPLLGMSKYGNTIVYAAIDGSVDSHNDHNTKFCSSGDWMTPLEIVYSTINNKTVKKNIVAWGTGKKVATPIIDVGYAEKAPLIPSYRYLQSQKSWDYGRMTNSVDCIAVTMDIDVYVQREPLKLENYSHIGKVTNIKAVSVRNMADASIHTLSNRDGSERETYQIFPHSMRHGRHGYDGIAVKYDTTDYGQ